MTTSVHFSIKYDGHALVSHQMDVRELAPALIALSELLEQSNAIAFPDSDDVRVKIQGSFKGGSFGVDLVAVQNIAQQIVSMFSGAEATAAANLLAIISGVGLFGSGLIGAIKWLNGRKPSSIRFEGDKAIFEIRTNETLETFETNLVAGKLYKSRVVKQSLLKVIKPLEREGVDSFECIFNGITKVSIKKEDLPSFQNSATEAEIVSSNTLENVVLQIESAVFKENNKWRFSDGSNEFHAEISDPEFLIKINSGQERFGKKDVLIVNLRRIQTITDNGLKVEHIIDKVKQHKLPLQRDLLND